MGTKHLGLDLRKIWGWKWVKTPSSAWSRNAIIIRVDVYEVRTTTSTVLSSKYLLLPWLPDWPALALDTWHIPHPTSQASQPSSTDFFFLYQSHQSDGSLVFWSSCQDDRLLLSLRERVRASQVQTRLLFSFYVNTRFTGGGLRPSCFFLSHSRQESPLFYFYVVYCCTWYLIVPIFLCGLALLCSSYPIR